ncbi:MAG: integrin alpha [Planctomycetota bacterium]
MDIRRPGGDRDQADFPGAAISLGSHYGSTYLDMAVGAPYDDNVIRYGEVHVFQGGPGFPSNAYSFTRDIDGYQIMDKFGFDVDFLGDQNGDGRLELAVGAPWFSTGVPAGRTMDPVGWTSAEATAAPRTSTILIPRCLPCPGGTAGVRPSRWGRSMRTASSTSRSATPGRPDFATQTEEVGEARVVVYHYR